MNTGLKIGGVVVLLIVAGFCFDVAQRGPREVSALESIAGIPYPRLDDSVQISEKLAHADIYLREPVFMKELELTIRFHPGNTKNLTVGVRENDFWLSYPPVVLWTAGNAHEWQERTITVPLTNKFQETDRSIDLMFFAETDTPTDIDAGINQTASWEVRELSARVRYTWPTIAETKDYIRSVLRRERAQ
ncbi:MAG: hypothetical protein HYR90_03235 [Candidatus Andersenbacteria bacterium]|nr:hypothetical protein [Candidatus Andersenbacteria bacterium]MBI3250278.1 hypothetical protein [Candidatus Andersenbacteria bacterium]